MNTFIETAIRVTAAHPDKIAPYAVLIFVAFFVASIAQVVCCGSNRTGAWAA